jgi:catechol 2,3-dioxygenase-like lactoylglutathione lyase family enzyme
MTCRISHTSVDCRDAYALSVWWGETLGMREDPRDPNEPGHEECMIFSADGRTRVLFIEVPDPNPGKNKLHFDLRPTERGRDAEVEWLIGRGATWFEDHRRPDGSGWITLTDPEGNEFCVLQSEAEAPDTYAHLVD